jgi:tetratricopeptide (TPR) repeat protein
MTPQEARKILGLGPADDVRSCLVALGDARDRIAAMVDRAPNEVLAARYRTGLEDFEAALARLQEDTEAAEENPVPPPAPTVVLGRVSAAVGLAAAVVQTEADVESPRPSRALAYFAWFLVFCVGVTGGVWLFLKDQEAKLERAMTRAVFLEGQGAIYIENRRWQEAADTFAEVESLLPGSEMAMRGRRSIEVGMAEEQTQFLGYWIGQATAELEAGRLAEAEAATRKVLDRFPDDTEAAAIKLGIAAALKTQAQDAAIAAARDELNQKKFDAAIAIAEKILASSPSDPDAKAILDSALLARAKAAADLEMAAELFRKAVERDQGTFDQQALDWIREAASLAPDDKEIAALLEKLSSYTRTLQVPGEFATLDEALASARDRDRIVVGAGTWTGPLVANVAVEIRGAGADETMVECSPENGSAFTVGPDAKGVIVSGISFRHDSFAVGQDRYSAVLVRGGEATFSDCVFTRASGHGLAVIEGGRSIVSRCKFIENGWNGVAAIGKGSTLEVRESEALSNFEHGIESWDGAAVVLVNNRCEGNSRNGIHADNGTASAEITGNELVANREFGVVLDSAGSGQVTKNVSRDNLLGGMVIRTAAQAVRVTANEATANHGPGLVLEKGLPSSSYLANSMSKNTGKPLLAGVDFDVTVESSTAQPPAAPPGMTRATPPPTPPATVTQPVPPRAKIVTEP